MKNIITLLLLILLYHTHANAQSGTWTWMHGADTAASQGNYGTKGVASPNNEPPSRYQAAYWKDLNGDFWVFGGSGSETNGVMGYIFNDLWKYNIASNNWTWMNGEKINTNQAGNYGTMGVPSVNNYPMARGWGSNCWTDKNNNLWLFGGAQALGNKDDIWKYSIATNEWTWMKGDSNVYIAGTLGVANINNSPSYRNEMKSSWTDKNNNLWMYGGSAYSSIGTIGGIVSDLWKFDISNNLWTCMRGDSTFGFLGNYGTLGIETNTNLPPARYSYTKWQDANDNFYIFGGNSAQGRLNNTWK